MRAFLAGLLTLAALARGADASTLYALHKPLVGDWSLSRVNPANHTAQQSWDLPARIWADLAARPDDVSRLYAVARLPGSAFESAISTIDLETGAVNDLFTFDSSDFGYLAANSLEPTGLAIAASRPSIATMSATLFDGTQLLFDLDLETGVRSNVQTLWTGELSGLSELIDLTYSSNETLYTNVSYDDLSDSYAISTIDRSDGSVDRDPAYSCCSAPWSIEFDPISGQLYRAELVASTTGDLELVHGLAFIVPEPGTGALLLLGLAGYGLASNGRGRSRTTSLRA